jgi:hypothetical protein
VISDTFILVLSWRGGFQLYFSSLPLTLSLQGRENNSEEVIAFVSFESSIWVSPIYLNLLIGARIYGRNGFRG